MGTRRGGSNVYPQRMFRAKTLKIFFFSSEIFFFLQLKKFLYITWACFRNKKIIIIILTRSEGMGLKCVGKSSSLSPDHDENYCVADDYYQGREKKG